MFLPSFQIHSIQVRLVCNTSTLGIIVPLGFDLFLIFMCTLYAVKTRNLPENFNEAKFIGFTMYTTYVIWLGFFPIYFAGQNKEVSNHYAYMDGFCAYSVLPR